MLIALFALAVPATIVAGYLYAVELIKNGKAQS